jgi:hypothetical protein
MPIGCRENRIQATLEVLTGSAIHLFRIFICENLLVHYTTERTKHRASNIIHYTTDQPTKMNAVKKRIMSHNKRREKNATHNMDEKMDSLQELPYVLV